MKIIFCGSRDWTDKGWIFIVMKTLQLNLDSFTVIEGENGEEDIFGRPFRGADRLARAVAEELGLPVEPYPANWTKLGRSAGPIRNSQMLNAGANGVVAFHLDLLKSRGTKNMIEQATKAGKPIWITSNNQDLKDLDKFIVELKK